jgi:sulfur-oxidizing protein SoxX
MKGLLVHSRISKLLLCLSLYFVATQAISETRSAPPKVTGETIAQKLCQACHAFKGADQAGTVAPPFIEMSKRFPDRKRLHEIIYDAQKALKPHTMMPPFGRHGFVTREETEKLIDFLYTL